MKTISKLHFITNNAGTAEKACRGGVDWVQLRMKNVGYEEFSTEAHKVKEICRAHNAALIINDNVQLALDIHAHGVHIGKEDMNPEFARELLGDNFIIGCTANTIEDVVRLSAMPIDYIGLGPFRFTTTKEKLSPVLGLEGYKNMCDRLCELGISTPPIIGIGGITEDDISALKTTGLYGIAVSGSIAHAADVVAAARNFKNKCGDDPWN